MTPETALDPAITSGGKPSAFTPTPQHVFLTGATGYLGAFLLRRLLDVLPTATIYCHVRAPDAAAGHGRLCKALADHLLWCVHACGTFGWEHAPLG